MGDDVVFGVFGFSYVILDLVIYFVGDFLCGINYVDNNWVNWFMFDWDYYVDLFFYCEVIGVVMNSVYIKLLV